MNGVVEKINNERISLLWTYPKTTQKLVVKICHNQMLESLGITKKCKTPLQKNTEKLITLRDARRKEYLNSSNKNLDELLKDELNHEEPP